MREREGGRDEGEGGGMREREGEGPIFNTTAQKCLRNEPL